MRILVYGMVGNHRGGIETFLLKMNQNMDEDIIFDYVIEEDECIHEDTIKARGGRIYYIASRNKYPFKNICENCKLLSQLRGEVGAIYFNLSSLSWIFPILIARCFSFSVFVHSHNADYIAANSSLGYRVVNYINKRWLHVLNVKRLTCSKPATDFMFMPSDKVEMIFNAINVERFAYNEEIRKMKRAELGIGEDVFLLGFVGRLQYQKNPLYLIKIMRLLISYPNIELLIVGEGDMRKEMEDIVNKDALKQIHFLGNRVDVNELYSAMDLFILPSFHEGLPFVVVEAQSSGLYCLLSNYITTEVDFTNNVVFLPLEENAENWTRVIMSRSSQRDIDRKSISAKSKESHFNIEREAKRLGKLLTNNN